MRGRKEGGFALVDILVSILVLAVAASAVISGILASRPSTAKAEQKDARALALNALLEELKTYVTADTANIPEAPGDQDPVTGLRNWHLMGDACAGCWALAPGPHVVSRVVNGASVTMNYTVTDDPNTGVKSVVASLDAP